MFKMLEKFNSTTRLIIGITLAVVIWIAGILIGQEQTVTILNPEGGLKGIITRSHTIRVSLMLDYGEGQVKVFPEVPIKYGQSVLNLLQAVGESTNHQLEFKYQYSQPAGQLNGFSLSNLANQVNGKKWLIWVNNSLQTDDYQDVLLKAKDVVELKYIKLKQ